MPKINAYRLYISLQICIYNKNKKWLPEYDIEHHQTQPNGDQVQHLFQY
jgi:hypothetical protein